MHARLTVLIVSTCLIACDHPPSESVAAADLPPAPPAAPPVANAQAPAEPAAAALPEVPAGAKVFFVAPADGATLTGPLENGKIALNVEMGATGITIKPAGAVEAGSGHHHILIDSPPVPAGTPVPKDEQHLHFGKGQAQASVALTPGTHSLMLQLADGIHRSYGPALSAGIKVSVVAAGSVGAQPTKAVP
jgi:hypothetical protein